MPTTKPRLATGSPALKSSWGARRVPQPTSVSSTKSGCLLSHHSPLLLGGQIPKWARRLCSPVSGKAIPGHSGQAVHGRAGLPDANWAPVNNTNFPCRKELSWKNPARAQDHQPRVQSGLVTHTGAVQNPEQGSRALSTRTGFLESKEVTNPQPGIPARPAVNQAGLEINRNQRAFKPKLVQRLALQCTSPWLNESPAFCAACRCRGLPDFTPSAKL